ncbi:MAG: hypothetical protein A2Y81_03125 [Nitrospirae bacterium RBG_13_43_8]|nr:MAG: hypothetical protein A2Y81_03125 [Nitrospirae bacterium RBG_13_43_8]
MRTKKIIRDITIIAVTTLGLLIALELILRVVFPDNIKSQIRPKSLAYEFNEDYLVRLKPNIEKTLTKEESGAHTIYWKTNKDCFRGNDLKENPEIRIIVYGDSSIEARFSKMENTYVHKLEKYLSATGMEDIEVINAGVVGFGPDQSLIRFVKEADIYRPDIVIFSITTHNDFGDIIRNRLFELGTDGNLIDTGHKRTMDPLLKERGDFIDFVSSLHMMKVARRVKGYASKGDGAGSKENDPADRLIQEYYSVDEQEYSVYKQSMPRYFSIFGDHYDLDLALSPDAESSQTKIKLMEGIIRRAKNVADKREIKFVVLIQPSVIDLTENFAFSYKHLERYPGYRRTNLTDPVKRICVSAGIDFVNLFDVFSRNSPEDLFFKGKNDHWNDQGQDIAAKETALYMIKKVKQKNDSLIGRVRQRAVNRQ